MARRRPAVVHGLAVIDKPSGCTSHDVVDRVRRVLGERKVGHSGTLDPDASGLLLIGVGNATRLLRFLDIAHLGGRTTTFKSYTGTVVLGTETDSLDASGSVTAEYDMSDVIASMTVESIQAVVDAHLTGDIDQIPPMVSALRIDGRRLHELAREGIEVEREARRVSIHSFTVSAVRGNSIDVRVACSSGTYIRSLAADLGRLLGGGAHLENLRRTAIGAFDIAEAIPLDDFERLGSDEARASLLPVLETCRALSALHVTPEQRQAISVGAILPRDTFAGEPPWAAVFDDPGQPPELLAVYEPFGNERVGENMARPAVVLVSPQARSQTT